MLKNLIFDFGNVLVRFDPYIICSGYGLSKGDTELIIGAVFDRAYWDRLDDGTMSDGECEKLFLSRLPKRLSDVSVKIFENWFYKLPSIPGMEELVAEMKQRGLHLYLLSDISRRFAENYSSFPVLAYFDGLSFSGITGLSKNFVSAFDFALDRFRISPEETLFIDDKKSNVENAERAKLQGYLFDGDAQKLRRYIINKITEET